MESHNHIHIKTQQMAQNKQQIEHLNHQATQQIKTTKARGHDDDVCVFAWPSVEVGKGLLHCLVLASIF